MSLVERFADRFADNLSAPLLYDSDQGQFGFRYAKPDVRHFCLLKLARMISALNAMIWLSRGGFTQELHVLARTLIECNSYIEYVLLSINDDGTLQPRGTQVVERFFSDFARDKIEDYKSLNIKQGTIHKTLGAEKLRLLQRSDVGQNFSGIDPELMHSRIYVAFSAYVHCKYPETMDMFGGDPLRPAIHLRGMLGTPKDRENVSVIDTYCEMAEVCARFIIVRLGLADIFRNDAPLTKWYDELSSPL